AMEFLKESRANREKRAVLERLTSSRLLALAALGTMDTDPERSLLLATEALVRTYETDPHVATPEALNALHRALHMSRIRFRFQCGPEPVNAVCFSADSSLVAAGSASGTAKIWSA